MKTSYLNKDHMYKRITKGYEGTIFKTKDGKIYKHFHLMNKEMLENKKLKLEILNKKNIPFITTPIEIIINQKGNLTGYIMDEIKESVDPSGLDINSKIEYLIDCSNKLKILKDHDILVLDLKDDNINLDKKGNIILSDSDSYKVDNIKEDNISLKTKFCQRCFIGDYEYDEKTVYAAFYLYSLEILCNRSIYNYIASDDVNINNITNNIYELKKKYNFKQEDVDFLLDIFLNNSILSIENYSEYIKKLKLK